MLDDEFVQLHQQQSRDTAHNEVRNIITLYHYKEHTQPPVQYSNGEQSRTQTVSVEDAVDRLAKL